MVVVGHLMRFCALLFQLPGHGCDRHSYLKDHQIETYLIVPGDTYRQVSRED